MKKLTFYLVLTGIILNFNIIRAQEPSQIPDTSRNNALRLFIDCQGCDMNFIRQEIPYVNYVRDVKEAQVYMMITRQSTGSGGSHYTLFYNGLGEYGGMKDTLDLQSSPDDTQDVTRTALTNTIAMGLMRYVAKTPVRNNVSISYRAGRQEEPQEVVDNWNFWVFSLETSPDVSMEKYEERYAWRNSIRINRVTPEWKIQNNFSHNYNLNVFYEEDDETDELIRTDAVRKSWSLGNLTVRSISDHWSAGVRANASSSTFSNLDFKLRLSPALEYNFFPYYESNQRQLTALYGVSYIYNDYADSTIYNKMEENLFEQSLDISFQVQQKWGSANISLGASNYFHDFSKNSVEIEGSIRIRLLRGLSVNLNAGVDFIHNQVELVKGRRTPEQVYLRLRELETNYRFDAGVGISYTFGSIYNNVVNPRF